MTEAEARAIIAARATSDQMARLDRFVALVTAESGQQNLIARSTLGSIWERHILDSAQLVWRGGNARAAPWVDIGSGAGFPGIVTAILTGHDTVLVEPRRLRGDFLEHCATSLGLVRCRVVRAKAINASIDGAAAVISARAVAPLVALLRDAHHLADPETLWVLPKGRGAQLEVAAARRSWHGMFQVEQSIVDPASGIIVATKVRPR